MFVFCVLEKGGMCLLVASVPSAVPLAAIVGILILLRKESTFFF